MVLEGGEYLLGLTRQLVDRDPLVAVGLLEGEFELLFGVQQQELSAGGEMDLGVRFFLDVDLPADINELTLSYTMFLVGDIGHEQTASHHE